MRRLVLLAVLLAAAAHAQPAERYAEVTLAGGPDLPARLAAAGVGLDHAAWVETPAGRALRTVLRADEVALAQAAGLDIRVLDPDVGATSAARAAGGCPSTPYPITGTHGCYPTFDETLAILDAMRAAHPAYVSPRVSLGPSHEGRDVWMVEVGDQPGVDEGEPEVLFTALHHAREPQGLATVLHVMWDLLESAPTDPEAAYLLASRRLFVVPVLNPDGYVYNQTTAPGGGGLWRKNRRPNGGNVFGVDLNRNYGYFWGYDDNGSSPNPSGTTYRGPSGFSEPETQAVRDFLEGGRRVSVALNYHAYGNLLIYPWGYEEDLYTPDSARFADYGAALTAQNGYRAGTGNQTVGYLVNGDSDDWMYGEQTTKPLIFAMTPEVGAASDGFWPDPARLLPIAEENVQANRLALWYAGGAPAARGAAAADGAGGNGFLDPGEAGTVGAALENVGQAPLSDIRVRLVSTVAALSVDGAWTGPVTLAPGETLALTAAATAAPDAPLGPLAGALAVEVDFGGGYVRALPAGDLALGTPEAFLADDATSLARWTAAGGWGLATAYSVSAPTSFADSPSGPYSSNTDRTLTLAAPLDLTGTTAALLRFQARWDIEPVYDVATVEASTNGTVWTPLRGQAMRLFSGRGTQVPSGLYGYSQTQDAWIADEIDLTPYAGQPALRLRFRLRSDGSFTQDGLYVDDVTVLRYVDGGTVAAAPSPTAASRLDAPAPNPTTGAVTLRGALARGGEVRLGVYDVLGRRVRRLADAAWPAGPFEQAWDGRDEAGRAVAPGVYVVRLDAAEAALTRRVLVVR